MKATFLISTLLAILTTASPLAKQTAPASSAINFKLIATLVSGGENFDTDIQNWGVSSYHMGAGIAFAQLLPQTQHNRLFYANGTTNILSDEGPQDAMFPAGFELPPPANDTQVRVPVGISAAARGSWGLGVQTWGTRDGVAEFQMVDGGQWSVCNVTEWVGPLVQLFWQKGVEAPVPEGCAVVRLFPQCKF